MKSAVSCLAVVAALASVSFAQNRVPATVQPVAPRLVDRPMPVAGYNGIYCAGYVQTQPVDTSIRLIGAVEEQEQFNYAQDDLVYINMGADKGIHEGDMFSVIRPRGKVDSALTEKDALGFYIQEVGALEVVRVKPNISVARIKSSCDAFLLGDLVYPIPARFIPTAVPGPLDIFADPSGKVQGRIFMARDNQEMVARDQIIYVDLGRDDQVQAGDKLTIFRPLGKGSLFISDEDESVSERDTGYSSFAFKGGKFSNQGTRKSGERATGTAITTERAKEDRVPIRKVVGEAVILYVRDKAATAVITKTAQEVHTGDWVELQ
jgi:hypothetical protein